MKNVLSLFDGCSCGQIALNRANIPYTTYFASEIDKWAMKVTQANYPDTVQLGDVCEVKGADLPPIDLLMGGSPCQGFSLAGKGLNFDDERSKLFFEFVRIKKETNPKHWLFENVPMKKEVENAISEILGCRPAVINSALVSAQHRKRLYWTNIRLRPIDLFGTLQSDIPQPEDRGIYLKDILQPLETVGAKYFLNKVPKGFKGLLPQNKARTLRVGGKSSTTDKHNFDIVKIDRTGKAKANQGKASCLTAGGHSGGNHSDMDIICINPRKEDGTQTYQQDRTYDTEGKSPAVLTGLEGRVNIVQRGRGKNKGGIKAEDGKTPTLTSNSWNENNAVIYAQRGRYNKDGEIEQRLEANLTNKSNTLTTSQKDNYLLDGHIFRRLTPIEWERLQTVPDNYSNHVSNSQRYKMLGNGWTVEAIAHILSFINPNEESTK